MSKFFLLRTYHFLIFLFAFSSLFSQTEVKKSGDRWELHVDGIPFQVKGATFGYDNDVDNYDTYFEDLKSMGVNTIRTWGTGKNTGKLLDSAHKFGVKVMVGIWMRHGRPGMEADDSFNYLEDEEGKQAMVDDAIETVNQYKDHPAVLLWGIGNEVYLNMATDAEKVVYSKLLESICSKMKEIDSKHPIASVEAWTFGMDWWNEYVPSIDIYGLNAYGAGANFLQDEMNKKGIDKPYMITEFGVTGEWDIEAEVNGVKVEPTDEEKYNAILNGYREWILPKDNCLGVYVFHYNDGNDFVSPWLFTHHDGKIRPQYWAIREAYTSQKPINQVPNIQQFRLNQNSANGGDWITVDMNVTDQEAESLEYSFYYNQRIGSRKRKGQLIPIENVRKSEEVFEIQMPKEDGPVKIYVNVCDEYGNVGIASTGIRLKDEEARNKKYKVAKASLPFYVYKDGSENPYVPSGLMGDYEKIRLDMSQGKDVKEGSAAMKIHFDSYSGWYGVAMVDPPNDWGEALGGFDITGAEEFNFWAKSDTKNVRATIGFGLIESNKPFPDTAIESIEIKLSTKWKKYKIKTKKLDLSCIRSGFVLFSGTSSLPHTIYIDEVVFK